MSELAVSVLIPAFNECVSVGPLVEQIRKLVSPKVKALEIIVIDDGSSDETGEAALAAGARVVSHPINRGYGKTLRTGIEAATHEWIVMIDADSSYPPSEIVSLLQFAPRFDLVIGTRTGVHFWGSPLQAFLRWTYLKMASFTVGEPVPDANSGLRLVRKALVLERGLIECLGYSFTTTMTLSFLNAGRFVKFTPISFQAREGKSKVKPVRDILRTLQLMMEVFIVYNPLKLFVTLSFLPAAAAAALIGGYLFCGDGFWLIAGLLCAMTGLGCFLIGCLLDSIRMHWRPIS